MHGRPPVPEPSTEIPPGRRRERPRTVALVGLAALGLIAAACSGPGGNSPGAPPDAAAATTSSTVTPSRGSTSESPGPWSWNQASGSALDIGGGPGATLSAVLPPAAGRGWLIAGTRPNPAGASGASGASRASGPPPGSGGAATVWTSSDAVHWTATALAGGSGGTVAGATAWRNTTIVIGSSGAGTARRAVAWVSNPNGSYSVVDVSGDPTATVDAVAGGALGVFAAGTLDGELELWYSTDGQRWSPLPDGVKSIAASTDAHIVSLLATSGPVYAAGWARDGTELDGALWSSGDGIHWRRVAAGGQSPFRGPGDHLIDGLAQTSSGILAVGATRSGSTWWPASWLSPDGATWSPAEESFPLDGRPEAGSPGVVVRAVATPLTTTVPIGRTAPLSTTLVAAGGSDTAQRVWESTDGLHWTGLPLPAGAARSPAWRATLVATDGSTTVVLDSDPGQAHVLTWSHGRWSEPTSDAAAFGAIRPTARPVTLVSTGAGNLLLGVEVTEPSQALGSDTVTTDFLASRDGRHWARLSSGASIPDAAVTGVARSGDDLIAVGTIHPTTAPAPGVWTSSDRGRTWTPSGELAGGAAAGASAAAVARIGTQWVAVGQGAQPADGSFSGETTGGLAIGWTSADGVTWAQSAGLDPTPGVALEQPTGICTRAATTVVVGWTAQATTGTSATVWWSGDGTTWQVGTVAPTATTGAGESMEGCVATAKSFVAYGTAPGSDGQPEPALWTSTDGADWTRARIAGFGSATAFPIVSLATSSRGWLAAAGPTTTDLTARPPMAAASIPAEVSTELWTSTDGSTWDPIETGFPPSGATASGDAATGDAATGSGSGDQSATGPLSSPPFADGDYEVDKLAVTGDTAVAAGEIQGGLAIWWGTPDVPARP